MTESAAITVFGSQTCEDTAITTSRLRAWAVPYVEVDVDADPAGLARAVALVGHRVTPTVTVEGTDIVATEPTLEALAGIVRAAGIEVVPPAGHQLHGDLTTRAIPSRTLPTEGGGTFRLTARRGRRQGLLFFAHDPSCLPCFGYGRQLAAQRSAADDVESDVVIVAAGDPDGARAWRHGIDPAVTIVADVDGAWKAQVAAHLGRSPDDAGILVVDRFGAPRADAWAADAGGLMDPTEALAWARFVELDCPECSGELPWPVG